MSKIFVLYANKTKFYFFPEGPLLDINQSTVDLGSSEPEKGKLLSNFDIQTSNVGHFCQKTINSCSRSAKSSGLATRLYTEFQMALILRG